MVLHFLIGRICLWLLCKLPMLHIVNCRQLDNFQQQQRCRCSRQRAYLHGQAYISMGSQRVAELEGSVRSSQVPRWLVRQACSRVLLWR